MVNNEFEPLGTALQSQALDGTELVSAIQKEDLERLRQIVSLDNISSIFRHNQFAATPLIHAARLGSFRSAELLLNLGASLKESITTARGKMNAISTAVLHGRIEFLRHMRHLYNISFSAADNFGIHPLLLAIQSDNAAMFKFLLNEENFNKLPQVSGMPIMQCALQNGAYLVVKAMIEELGFSKRQQDYSFFVPSAAVASLNLSLIKYLYESNPYLFECTDEKNSNALHYAVQRVQNPKDLPVLEFLVSKISKAKQLDLNQGGWNPLHLCINQHPNIDVLACLLKTASVINSKTYSGWTPLHICAYSGKQSLAKLLIDQKCNLEEVNSNGETPLHIAASNGHIGMIELLLESKANPYAEVPGSRKEYDAIACACFSGQLRVILFFRKQKLAHKSWSNIYMLMELATIKDHITVLEFLFEEAKARHDANTVAQFKEKLLFIATQYGATQTFRNIVEKQGCFMHLRNHFVQLFHMAARGGHTAIVDFMLSLNRLAVHDTDGFGHTALHFAAQHGRLDTIKLLLANGANVEAEVNVPPGYNAPKKPVEFAQDPACINLLNMASTLLNLARNKAVLNPGFGLKDLLSRDASLLQTDSQGKTALHLAAEFDHPKLFKDILSKGNQLIFAQDKNGHTPLDLSRTKNFYAEYLLSTYISLAQDALKSGNTVAIADYYSQLTVRISEMPELLMQIRVFRELWDRVREREQPKLCPVPLEAIIDKVFELIKALESTPKASQASGLLMEVGKKLKDVPGYAGKAYEAFMAATKNQSSPLSKEMMHEANDCMSDLLHGQAVAIPNEAEMSNPNAQQSSLDGKEALDKPDSLEELGIANKAQDIRTERANKRGFAIKFTMPERKSRNEFIEDKPAQADEIALLHLFEAGDSEQIVLQRKLRTKLFLGKEWGKQKSPSKSPEAESYDFDLCTLPGKLGFLRMFKEKLHSQGGVIKEKEASLEEQDKLLHEKLSEQARLKEELATLRGENTAYRKLLHIQEPSLVEEALENKQKAEKRGVKRSFDKLTGASESTRADLNQEKSGEFNSLSVSVAHAKDKEQADPDLTIVSEPASKRARLTS